MRPWMRAASFCGVGVFAGLFAGFAAWGRAPDAVEFLRAYPDGALVRVARAVDGDTIILEDGMHVRYRGCDTAETFRFIRDPEPFAEDASLRNRELVEGAWVRLRFPQNGMPTLDAHGRLLADVRLDGEGWAHTATIAERLVEEGLGRASAFEMEREAARALREAEDRARAAGLGVWAEAQPEAAERLVATRRGTMYHRESCAYATRISERNAIFFHNVTAVQATGRTPCPTCRPDGPPERAAAADAGIGAGPARDAKSHD